MSLVNVVKAAQGSVRIYAGTCSYRGCPDIFLKHTQNSTIHSVYCSLGSLIKF